LATEWTLPEKRWLAAKTPSIKTFHKEKNFGGKACQEISEVKKSNTELPNQSGANV